MAGTRSSARLSSSPQSANSAAGTKRKAEDATPSKKAKRGRPSKEQKTLEETVPTGNDHAETNGDEVEEDEGVDVNDDVTGDAKAGAGEETTRDVKEDESKDEAKNAFDGVKADEGEDGKTTAMEGESKTNGHAEMEDVKAEAVVEDKEREKALPSNVLEKGIIYFFTRGRVGVEDPSKVQDLQRSYFVLRPLPDGAKLTDGAIQDVGNNRLIALPKKVWPKSGKDRFMVYVEKAKTSMSTLKEDFFQGSDYATQTMGTRHTPEVTPLGEGVYAMTTTGGGGQGTTHLAYMLTIPSELGDVQKDVGLAEKGSFILSVKSPESSAPSGAQLPQTADYPKEIVEEFAGRAWLPAKPKHIDYDNASFLIIGESFEKATEEGPDGDTNDKPAEELEKLEHEDELRVENISGDDTVFADLGISSKEYGLMTTW